MKRFIKAVKRLWVIGTCTHKNQLEEFGINNGKTELTIKVCKTCGRVIDGVQWSNEANAYKGVTA